MGTGPTVLATVIGLVVFAGLVVVGVLRISGRRRLRVPSPERVREVIARHEVPGSNLDPVALDLAAAEAAYRTELRGAPVVGVPYDAVRADGSHDTYPHMSQHARDAVIASLNAQLAMPARERAS